jgi:hypothetical protein
VPRRPVDMIPSLVGRPYLRRPQPQRPRDVGVELGIVVLRVRPPPARRSRNGSVRADRGPLGS